MCSCSVVQESMWWNGNQIHDSTTDAYIHNIAVGEKREIENQNKWLLWDTFFIAQGNFSLRLGRIILSVHLCAFTMHNKTNVTWYNGNHILNSEHKSIRLQYSCADWAKVWCKPEAVFEEHNDFLHLNDSGPQVYFIMSLSVSDMATVNNSFGDLSHKI